MGLQESAKAAATKARRQKLLSFEDTDAGNAEAFELLHGHRFRYNRTSSKWLLWNGRYWSIDEMGEAERAALDTVRARRAVAALIKDPKLADQRFKWTLKSESIHGREALLKSAQTNKLFATTAKQFDRKSFLLTVANGTIDLTNGQLSPALPEDLITKATEAVYDPNATAPRWLEFLDEVFSGDADLIAYVQRAVGYSLTGDTREQCLFILFGVGANGKSTFVETLCKLLGTHAETAEFSTFLVRRNSGAPRNDLARLNGARFVKAAESEHQAPLNEALVKEVTGEDTIAARFLFQEHFSFKPRFKIWLISNHKPDIRGTDHAIWRRVRLIPFERQFEGARRDSRLRETLEAELSGILTWAVQGCLAWQKHGLGESPRIKRATLEYRQESDQVGRFLEDQCTREVKSSAPAQELFNAYIAWCAKSDVKPEANNQFARRLRERGISKKRTRRGWFYQGVGLAPVATLNVVALPPAQGKS
jgi:putative DNA primase/helicase